jgi:hypothetical protein
MLVRKIAIDGCLIADDRPRCDFVFEVDEECRCAAYVELKGSDVSRAHEQILSTLRHMNDRHQGWKIRCFIVASRVPRFTPTIQRISIEMARTHGARLKVATNQLTVDAVTDLCDA